MLSCECDSRSQGSGVGGLSAYLEDIDSDDDDSLLRDEEDDKLTSSAAKFFPANATDLTLNHQGLPPAPPIIPSRSAKLSPLSTSPKQTLPNKEELLQMMEKVDRDIAATETQIVALQNKQVIMNPHCVMHGSNTFYGMLHTDQILINLQFIVLQAELEESAKLQKTSAVSPPLSTPSPFHTSPVTLSLDVCESRLSDQLEEEGKEEEDELGETPVMSPSGGGQRMSLKRSLCDVIYAENKVCVCVCTCYALL